MINMRRQFLPEMVKLVSSANILGTGKFKQLGKSLMYIKNNRAGPRIDPVEEQHKGYQRTLRGSHFDSILLAIRERGMKPLLCCSRNTIRV